MKNYKKSYIFAFCLIIVGSIFTFIPNQALAVDGWVERQGSGMHAWTSIASSSDGMKLVAVDINGWNGGYIYTSTDSGVTWITQTGSGLRNWWYVTSSDDGTKLAAADYEGYIYTSTDGGITWIPRTGTSAPRYWSSIGSSSNGNIIFGVGSGSWVHISPDGGESWTNGAGWFSNWSAITSSANGSKMFAGRSNSYLYISGDGGATWTTNTNFGLHSWQAITSSDDGMKLVALVDGYIYTSTDSGDNWVKRMDDTTRSWWSVASSSDGTKLAAVVGRNAWGYIYISTDSGVTWIEQTSAGLHNWRSVASSSDGNKLVASNSGGYIYTSNSFPTTSTPTITGTPNINQELTGHFTYTDADGDAQGTHTYKWYRDEDVIEGATSISYTTTLDDIGHTLYFEVTPVASTGTTPGIAVKSAGIDILNLAPVATSPLISGSYNVGNTLTGSYAYTDTEGDLQGTSTYKWYRDDVVVDGQTSITYETTRGDIDKTIKFEVTPVSLTGTTEGEPVLSTGILIKNEPARGSSIISFIPSIITKPTPPTVESPIITLPITPSDNLTNTNSNRPVTITHTLKPKVRSDEVKALQIYLNTHGYPVATSIPGLPAQAGSLGHETNYFGSLTKAAVIKFQIANHLVGDGVVGPMTRRDMK